MSLLFSRVLAGTRLVVLGTARTVEAQARKFFAAFRWLSLYKGCRHLNLRELSRIRCSAFSGLTHRRTSNRVVNTLGPPQALYESIPMRRFSGIHLGREPSKEGKQ